VLTRVRYFSMTFSVHCSLVLYLHITSGMDFSAGCPTPCSPDTQHHTTSQHISQCSGAEGEGT